MILIISIEFDQSTYEVANWIKFITKGQVIILNENNHVKEISATIESDGKSDVKLFISKGDKIELNSINALWIRKGSILFEEQFNESGIMQISLISKRDISALNDFIYFLFDSTNVIGELNNAEINKFIVLKEAASAGLTIPQTMITNRKKYLYKYFREKNIIAKSIHSIQFQTRKLSLVGHTKLLENSMIPDKFSISLTQEEVIKKYELRVFFLNNKFFASAIFSQSNNKTKLDFRNYDIQKPNRIVPYILPEVVKKKLTLLMKKLGLNTGSIDMIVNSFGEYIFLEVNPVGQFGMISKPCNYYLEREIAQTLILTGNERM
ncbi:MAG: grasp-with-spasm system ATP-grasp peptide maturase [Lentimicrobiaceae bacterium]|jgi:ATP-GRASP peptide maturase of grasp-with-spasm system|nr:grasp-with-spasm system ATP-grasp peptide maturase [Lentimicrobiaceae bacterium]